MYFIHRISIGDSSRAQRRAASCDAELRSGHAAAPDTCHLNLYGYHRHLAPAAAESPSHHLPALIHSYHMHRILQHFYREVPA